MAWCSSRSKRTAGCSLVVPWIRRSATSTIHLARWRSSCSKEVNDRPAKALCLTYPTPRSIFPLVRARRGRQALGVNPRSRQKASKPGFQTTSPDSRSWDVTRGEALSQRICSVRLPKCRKAPSSPSSQSSLLLREESPAVETPRISQNGGHQVDLHGLPGDSHDLFAEVDLNLMARCGLEPDCGQGLRPFVPGEGSATARCRVRRSTSNPRSASSC